MSGEATAGQAGDAAFWGWMDSYVDEPHNAQYEVPDLQCAYEAGQVAGRAEQSQPATAAEVERLRGQVKVIRELAEGACAGNLATTPRGRFAAAILSQLDSQ